MSDLKDEELVIAVQKGKSEAFAELVQRFEPKMLRYARKFLFDEEDSQDLVQEIFVKAYVNIKSFDTDKRFSPWLYRIAHNEFINAIGKKTRNPIFRFELDTLLPHPIAKETADSEAIRQDLRRVLDHSLSQIDPKYREPLVLYFFEEFDYKEIAEILHLPVSTVGVRLQRGKNQLKKILETKESLT